MPTNIKSKIINNITYMSQTLKNKNLKHLVLTETNPGQRFLLKDFLKLVNLRSLYINAKRDACNECLNDILKLNTNICDISIKVNEYHLDRSDITWKNVKSKVFTIL